MTLRFRKSVAVVAVAFVLAGCDAAQRVSPSVGTGSNSRVGPNRIIFSHGGRFAAAYSGSYSQFGDCSGTRMFTYHGNGNAKFLRSTSEQIKLTWYCGTRDVKGSATLTSIQVPRDSITASVSVMDFDSPCYSSTLSFTVTGGTGRFRRAAGSGSISLHRPSSECLSYSYSDKWKGTLTF